MGLRVLWNTGLAVASYIDLLVHIPETWYYTQNTQIQGLRVLWDTGLAVDYESPDTEA